MAERTTKAKAAGDKPVAPDAALTTAAAPIETPERYAQRQPEDGHPESTTNNVAAHAGLRSITGSNHKRLLSDDPEPRELSVDEIFEFPAGDSPKATATVRMRVIEEFIPENASTPTRHLLFVAGQEVPLWQARQFQEHYRQNQNVMSGDASS